MLKAVGKDSLEELFEHIPSAVKFTESLNLADELEYVELKEKFSRDFQKKPYRHQFLGDGVLDLVPSSVVGSYLRHS